MKCPLFLFAYLALSEAVVPKRQPLSLLPKSLSETAAYQVASYEDFLHRHGHRQGVNDTIGFETRRALYHDRLKSIEAHNNQKRSWVAGVNKFADFTNEERRALLGYKRYAKSSRPGLAPSSLLELQADGQQIAHQRASFAVDWSRSLISASFVRDQGSCGSCWAVASTGALEMHAELRGGGTSRLAYQELVDCVQNPNHCGGSGGCHGATAELAFEYVQKSGLARDDNYADASSSISDQIFGGGCKRSATPAVSVTGWHKLPSNENEPLRMALSNVGPVVVSVDGSAWFDYDSGVFDGCQKDTVINHAVLAIGYGKDDSMPKDKQLYWRIRNSWGQGWGEGGHIRLLRHEGHEDWCGIDKDPSQGSGCTGGPAYLPVCGMCGVLSDSSHPVGTVFHK